MNPPLPSKKLRGLSAAAISRLTGHTPESVALALKGFPKPWGSAAIEIVKTSVKNYARPEKVNGREPLTVNIDPETQLTWQQKKIKMEARSKELDNIERERRNSNDWMLVTEHHEILSLVIERVEQISSWSKTTFGLSDAQTKQLAARIDEMRESAAKELEKKQ